MCILPFFLIPIFLLLLVSHHISNTVPSMGHTLHRAILFRPSIKYALHTFLVTANVIHKLFEGKHQDANCVNAKCALRTNYTPSRCVWVVRINRRILNKYSMFAVYCLLRCIHIVLRWLARSALVGTAFMLIGLYFSEVSMSLVLFLLVLCFIVHHILLTVTVCVCDKQQSQFSFIWKFVHSKGFRRKLSPSRHNLYEEALFSSLSQFLFCRIVLPSDCISNEAFSRETAIIKIIFPETNCTTFL